MNYERTLQEALPHVLVGREASAERGFLKHKAVFILCYAPLRVYGRFGDEKMNQKITVLCDSRFPSTAAHGAYLARACESLAGLGVSVELVAPKRFKEVRADPLEYYSVKTPFSVRKIWSFDFLIFGPVLGRLAFALQYGNFYLFVLGFFLFRSRRRIIYTMDSLGCLLAFFGYRVVFETHVGIGSYRKNLLPLLKKAERLIAVNSIIKNDFVRAGFAAENILVAPNGVDLAVFSGPESKEELRWRLDLPLEARIIAYVGKYKTMAMAKGVDELARAFAYLLSKSRDIHLLIVGLSDGEKRELALMLGREGVPVSAYTLAGHVPPSEVALFTRASDALVMNYPDTPYYRNFMSPMKMFEYMASGNPIVTSDLPSIREVLNESNAVCVKPDDPEDLARGLKNVLGDAALGKRLAERARRDVASYTWQKRAERILAFIGATP